MHPLYLQVCGVAQRAERCHVGHVVHKIAQATIKRGPVVRAIVCHLICNATLVQGSSAELPEVVHNVVVIVEAGLLHVGGHTVCCLTVRHILIGFLSPPRSTTEKRDLQGVFMW